ncbi:E3 ubiquitin ligase Rnf157 isoform X1 [Frieseomelitta varia]|uniref:E3 ubiquitin ligase Rnf157 isoform X1 n=1 Tax=Frieseomelitta varia TaxID=561572 RepID=UPI001CB68A94|nr:E3 ubiquitin ligase Rnf157 isoform X1 [Frieseomelitta varia]XP_043516433.1 E3 ubiquitin ligase Rnf157 isoform X1 [Frieseomelitta varia]XP_043516434.1 E3 ubiquitin ligase Rnf157 isoform X1 [Frieseomelitta varia]XP_043516436.1 E3 ubiquitin ligase Rnf157 isoform X1 [Frieseomelitta varia]
MGSLTSRQNAGVEEVDIVSNHAYKYPPRSGSYFGSHFIMGGERFDTPQPEAYLFGENADLNFLGSRPTPFPYPPPQANDPTKTLKSLVNIRRESLRLVRNVDQTSTSPQCHNVKHYGDGDLDKKSSRYNIEFTFDCDVRCAITIYYFCTEEITTKGVTYIPRDPSMNSETYYYKKGANQLFSQTSHTFDPTAYSKEDLLYNADREIIPIAIHCVAEEGSDEPKQSHTTIAVVEKHSDGTYVLKALKQKLYVDGLCYLLQEIYGIENKNAENAKQQGSDEDTDDNGSECVICMCDVRDTLILPCRHLCLCNSCADSLRYQANNCPICRAPFRALLQIKALQKATGAIISNPPLPEGSCENIPAGYEAVSLIEALNGPYIPRTAVLAPESPDTPDTDTANAIQAAEALNRSIERTPVSKHVSSKEGDISARTSGTTCPTPEFRMSVLLARDEHSGSQKDLHNRSPAMRMKNSAHLREKAVLRSRDTLRLVNEKQPVSLYEYLQGQGQDEDSEAEKLSPLLDAATSTEALDTHSRGICDIDIDDEIQNTENENDADITCHSH